MLLAKEPHHVRLYAGPVVEVGETPADVQAVLAHVVCVHVVKVRHVHPQPGRKEYRVTAGLNLDVH